MKLKAIRYYASAAHRESGFAPLLIDSKDYSNTVEFDQTYADLQEVAKAREKKLAYFKKNHNMPDAVATSEIETD